MKTIRLVITLICALSTSMAIGQDISKQVRAYNKEGHVDSSYMLIEEYISEYETAEKWDSMASVMILKLQVYSRDKSAEEQLDLAEMNEKFIIDKLGENNARYLENLLLQSRVHIYNGMLSDAMEGLNSIIEKDKALQSEEQVGHQAMANKAYLLLYSNKVNEGVALAEEALNTFQEGIDTFFLIQAYQVMSIGLTYIHEIERAMEYTEKSLELNIARFGRNHPNVGVTLDDLGSAHKEMGQYDKALKFQNESKSIQYKYYQETGNGNFISNVLGNTSLTYSNLGEYQLAFENVQQAIEIQEKIFGELNINLLWYYQSATEILIKYEKYDQAQVYVDKAMRILTLNNETDEYDKNFVKSYQAEIFYGLGKNELAIKMAKEVYEYLMSKDDKTVKDFIHITSVISDSYSDLGEFEEANNWIEIGNVHMGSYYVSTHSEMLNSQMRKMLNNFQSGKLEANEDLFQKILKSRNNSQSNPSLRNCMPGQYMIGICEIYASNLYTRIVKGEIEESKYFEFLDDFAAYFEVHLAAIRSSSRVQEESKVLKGIYHPGIKLLRKKDPEKVILLAEQIKSFQTRLILKSQLLEQEESEKVFGEEISSILETHKDTNRLNTFIEVSHLIEDFKSYKDSLYRNDINTYRKRYGLKEVKLSTIRKGISKEEILVEYFQFDSLLYVIYVSQKDVKVLSMNFSDIEPLISSHLESRSRETSKIISKKILDYDLISDYERLLIVPDEKLFFINFEELIAPSGNYLLEGKTIRYAYSASILEQQKELTSMDRSNKNILGLTPGFSSKLKESYINDSKGDIQDSSWLYFIQQPFLLNLATNLSAIDNSISLISQDATESNYKSEAANFKILHLGTHGILNDESPLFSKLIFAKDSIEDGYLHTYEIYGQTLNADLAVLSACNSGNGKVVEGEGVLSLSHAFTHAGCPSTLMTLWEVDEKSTSIILESFYENLKSGQQKSTALRNAKLSFLESAPAELQDPYYWAGLVLIGNDDALFSRFFSFPWWIIFVIIGFVLLGVWRRTSR